MAYLWEDPSYSDEVINPQFYGTGGGDNNISLGQSLGAVGGRTQTSGSGSGYWDRPARSVQSQPAMSSFGGYSSVRAGSVPDNRKISSTTQTSTPVAPGIAMPKFGDVPVADEARIRRLTQTRSAAGQRALRSALRENILSASYQDNPNVGAMITRKAMEGFGQGIAETYSRAQREASAEEYRDRQMKFGKQQAVFGAAMQNYMRRFGSKSQTDYSYDSSEQDEYQYTLQGGQTVKSKIPVTSSLASTRQAWLDKVAAYKASN